LVFAGGISSFVDRLRGLGLYLRDLPLLYFPHFSETDAKANAYLVAIRNITWFY